MCNVIEITKKYCYNIIQNKQKHLYKNKQGGNMFKIFGEKTPAQRIRQAEKSTQILREKRSKLSPISDEKKIWKINNKIHANKVEKSIAYKELEQPKRETRKTNNNILVKIGKTDKSKQIHFHGHYHSHKDK